MEVQLKAAGKNELEEVAALATEIWNDHYPAIIGQEQVDYMLGKFYSRASLEEQTAKGQVFYFILVNGTHEGFVSVTHTPEKEELFIHKFYIRTQKQKSGLGTASLHAVEQLYPQATYLRLTVNRQNFKSVNFYFKNGFIIEQVADFDIGQGYVMNDFVMVKKR